MRRRSARYLATLIYIDGPQLILFEAGTMRILGIAIPDTDQSESKFLSVTVTNSNWQKYIRGNCDLRYLFTYPKDRNLFYCDLQKLKNDRLWMEPYDGEVPEEHLPLSRIFAEDHTHEWDKLSSPIGVEKLGIDGSWEMQEFGQFYQRYSDIYGFISATDIWQDPQASQTTKVAIKAEFLGRPFRGGFSYVHFFTELMDRIPANDRPSLKKVKYASPGVVELKGKPNTFKTLEKVIENFLANKKDLKDQYSEFHKYLSKQKLLRTPGSDYKTNEASSAYISQKTKILSDSLGAFDFDLISELSNKNALVAAKIVLAMFRRVEEAASFFAQGRMSFNEYDDN